MGLPVEDADDEPRLGKKKRRKAVAEYVRDRDDDAPDGDSWEEWLQTHRVELNAMTTPQFIEWLNDKMEEHDAGKLIPPSTVIRNEFDTYLEKRVRDQVRERILQEAGFERQITDALKQIKRPSARDLIDGIRKLFQRAPASAWRDYITTIADRLTQRRRRKR